jgi:hypothetical protein
MRDTVEKAKVINAKSNVTWQVALHQAAALNKLNKTQLIIAACNEGPVHIDDAMAMTGLNKNNLQSRFRKDKIYCNKVYYDKTNKVFRHVA